jgi:hypothetical protein
MLKKYTVGVDAVNKALEILNCFTSLLKIAQMRSQK